jgi:hypothetical protein
LQDWRFHKKDSREVKGGTSEEQSKDLEAMLNSNESCISFGVRELIEDAGHSIAVGVGELRIEMRSTGAGEGREKQTSRW